MMAPMFLFFESRLLHFFKERYTINIPDVIFASFEAQNLFHSEALSVLSLQNLAIAFPTLTQPSFLKRF